MQRDSNNFNLFKYATQTQIIEPKQVFAIKNSP